MGYERKKGIKGSAKIVTWRDARMESAFLEQKAQVGKQENGSENSECKKTCRAV
jgi:hypothetical protein